MSALTQEQVQKFADDLYNARRDGTSIAPISESVPGLGVAEGYAIQRALVDRLLADGERIVGFKLGLTSAPMQTLLGVNEPDFGPLFASAIYPDGAQVDIGAFIAPRVEAEIAVVLDRGLSGPGCTPADAYQATKGLLAAIEIVDSRITDWKINIGDTIADLASSGALALASRVVPITQVDPRLVGMIFTRNGELVATGAGAAALGDPMAAVAWLANTLAPMGVRLEAGSVIMTGALHAMVPVAPGDTFRAEFDHLGPITLQMVEGKHS